MRTDHFYRFQNQTFKELVAEATPRFSREGESTEGADRSQQIIWINLLKLLADNFRCPEDSLPRFDGTQKLAIPPPMTSNFF